MGIHIMVPLYEIVLRRRYGLSQTSIFYPNPHPETTSVDGYTYEGSAGNTWAQTHDLPGMGARSSENLLVTRIWAYVNPNTWSAITRPIILFDTSLIPAGSLINEAYIEFYLSSKRQDPPLSCALGIYKSYPNSNIDLVATDYQHFYTVLLTNKIPYANITAGNNRFTFTPENLSAIIPAGITKLGVREANYDVPNIEPPWASEAFFDIYFYAAEWGTVSRRPRLTVTYQPPL